MSPLDVTLTSERLILRPLHEGDADELLATYGDPEVVRYWSGAPWTERARAVDYIASGATDIEAGTAMRLGVELKETGRCIGQVSLFNFDVQNRRCDMGYALNRGHWGHGYMGEALRVLLEFGFGALGLNRMEADIDPRNAASLRTVERLGFVQEGLLRERWLVNGEVCDTALYGLLLRDWLARGHADDRT